MSKRIDRAIVALLQLQVEDMPQSDADVLKLHGALRVLKDLKASAPRGVAPSAPLRPSCPPGVDVEVWREVCNGHKISAIRLYRERTRAGLADSKEYVESALFAPAYEFARFEAARKEV